MNWQGMKKGAAGKQAGAALSGDGQRPFVAPGARPQLPGSWIWCAAVCSAIRFLWVVHPRTSYCA